MIDLSDISKWQNFLGLLPLRLSPSWGNESKYILLNGGTKDFCLQLNEDVNGKEFYFSSAWSSNTKNFVVYNNGEVFIFNWKKNREEKINKALVEENFPKFWPMGG